MVRDWEDGEEPAEETEIKVARHKIKQESVVTKTQMCSKRKE